MFVPQFFDTLVYPRQTSEPRYTEDEIKKLCIRFLIFTFKNTMLQVGGNKKSLYLCLKNTSAHKNLGDSSALECGRWKCDTYM